MGSLPRPSSYVSVVVPLQNSFHFKVVPLGVHGGSTEENLSAYLLALSDSNSWVALDAGTIHAGLAAAVSKGSLTGPVDSFMRAAIKGYLISHPHLDHVAGLIINSPEDAAKTVYALPACLSVIEDKYFSWKSWANFGDEGEKPQLKKYHFENLGVDSLTSIAGTGMTVRAFPLSHGNPYQSTAFLVGTDEACILYLGDTGADSLEKSTRLKMLWEKLAPLIRQGKLKGIFIETSFADEQPAAKLFGHLTPALLMREMEILAGLAGLSNLQKVPVLITHIKPGAGREQLIPAELKRENRLQLTLLFPEQGTKIQL